VEDIDGLGTGALACGEPDMRIVGAFLVFIAIKSVYHAAVPSPRVRLVLDLLLLAGAAIYVVFAYRRKQEEKEGQKTEEEKAQASSPPPSQSTGTKSQL
jgi:hypothetical protein